MKVLKRFIIATVMIMIMLSLTVLAQFILPDIRYWEADYEIGWKHTPNFSGIFKGSEFKSKIRFNKEGFRDREHKINKEEDILRICVIGDSFVEGLQVNEEKLITTILERKLNAIKKTEVMNFGVSNFGTANEYLTYKTYVRKYKPDYVVIIFSVNDFIDNNELLSNRISSIELMKHRPYFSINTDGNLIKNDFAPFRRNMIVNGLRRIRLLSSLHNIMLRLKAKKRKSPCSMDEIKFYEINFSREIENSVRLTKKLLQEFLLTIIKDRVTPIICLFYPAYIINTYHKNRLTDCGINFGEIDIDKPLNIIKKLCQSINVDVVDTRSLFAKEYASHSIFFFKEGHWNEKGHEIVATCIAEKIVSKFIMMPTIN